MKKKLSIFIVMLFILFILIYPKDCVTAAANGLVLWYENSIPRLLIRLLPVFYLDFQLAARRLQTL